MANTSYPTYDDTAKKYQQMVKVRKESCDIDINDYLPNIYEMIKEDCVWEAIENIQKEFSKTPEAGEKIAYYSEAPPTTTPGYYESANCFVLRCSPGTFKNSNIEWELGEADGDTWPIPVSYLDAGGAFTINDKTYNTFEEYTTANGLNCKKLSLRSCCIDASEVCHYITYSTNKSHAIHHATYETAVLRGYNVMPFKINTKGSKDPDKWKYTDYDKNDQLNFIKSGNSYYQIVDHVDGSKWADDDATSSYVLYMNTTSGIGKNTLADGYKAQERARQILEHDKIKDIIVVLDRNVVLGKKLPSSNILYNSFMYDPTIVIDIYKQIRDENIMDFTLKTAEYLPFGCDKYGRSLGNIWVKIGTSEGDMWINLSKYVVTGSDFTVTNPTFYNTEMSEIYGGLSDALKQWTNTSNQYRYVDSLSSSGIESYENRIALHKQLTGIDFSMARDHTVLLGDTLFIIPPESIHTSSTLDYERLPILRGKGSMMKNRTNVEELLELELYFNNEYGINGIPYTTETPSGQEITYYMNGLRALIAQFKVAPYLPIENHYINDILNIEAVSLVNINVTTVDGFPKLLRVILTLREFNYRVFMPDLPAPDYTADNLESTSISEMQPIFAQCFDWELFRYYYQRGLINGELLNQYEYNSSGYIDTVFSNKNLYTHSDLADCNFEMYVPDVTWLKSALQVKKSRDQYGQSSDVGYKEDFDPSTSNGDTFIITMNNNEPVFEKDVYNMKSAERYSDLDKLGRCGPAFAVIAKDIMPKDGEERGDISKVTPSGWNNRSYDILKEEGNADGFIYNRCHLIGWQLTGENANKKNLITGTRYMNVGNGSNSPDMGGMLYYENYIAKYMDDNPDKRVAYRVTPIYDGNNLVAAGVQLEALSLDDNGKGVKFNVYIANIQPGILIDYRDGDTMLENDQSKEISEMYDYKDPRNMQFVPYLEDGEGKSVPIELDALSFSMSNTFTETHLKAQDGYAPQYMGGSDVTIEMKMTITSEYYVAAFKNLPHVITDMIRNYRRVMPCYPLKIKNEYLQMIGVHEVTLDNVTVSTKPGFPGVFDVTMRMTSMDRTMRQREALNKVTPKDAMTSSSAIYGINDYFNLETVMARAELYPDLDLPTIDELSALGWRFAKWTNENRVYVDPDFYVCYSFQYSARLVKEIVYNVLYKVGYKAGYAESMAAAYGEDITADIKRMKEEAKKLTKTQVMDSTGMSGEVSAGIEFDGVDLDSQCGFSEKYNDIMSAIATASSSAKEVKRAESAQARINKKNNTKVIINAIEYLTASGIENGWQVAPGWYAPLCDTYVNDELAKLSYAGVEQDAEPNEGNNEYIEAIYDLRHRAIMLIDRILDAPLNCTTDAAVFAGDDPIMKAVDVAVGTLFGTADGQKLLDILCPMRDHKNLDKNDLQLTPTYFETSDPLRWIRGFLYALACVRSGDEQYSSAAKENSWQPNQFQKIKYDKSDKEAKAAGYADSYIPYVLIENRRANSTKLPTAQTYDSWHKEGMSFGAGQIKRLPVSEIKRRFEPESKVKYFSYSYKGGASEYYNNMYHKTKRAGRKRFCEEGFIDPYYNFAGYRSKIGKEYIHTLGTCTAANMEALLREVLMYMKRLIMDGYLFNEVDIIAQDWESVVDELMKQEAAISGPTTPDNLMSSQLMNTYRNSIIEYDSDKDGDGESTKEEEDENTELSKMAAALREEIPKSYKKLFCARFIYAFSLAACDSDTKIWDVFRDRDYKTLSTYTLSANVGGTNNPLFSQYLSAMFGTGMIGTSKLMDTAATTSNTQKAFNTLMSEAFTALAEDPRCYALHSFYDMCATDKRGRLLRAFPCYYILFVDEGRQIGTWRLFDNFYNMSSISDLEVVKSRKMPADTCTFTMSNMFMSYADTYDNTIYNKYVDVYGFDDLFASVFSPGDFIQKEDAINKRKELMDTTPISAGVRIHVRMGYGSDGSRLPIVFNGKVAEINCGEIVEIVAQGDGHELNNPLNTLGELTAINLEESQSSFTWFKDIRGSLARGGETPRNLLAKLATAQYGGTIKTVIRNVTNGRFFYDNPFGLYHFGDKRFKDIFEDSEIVQNMYEISSKTILNGVNDLMMDTNMVQATPTINCSIQDKTMWEIGHLCANSGDDYYFAVRDFGLRSTMCLCKANHYYAYAYEKVVENDATVEKRKPFQQFHYYDSYNDIIYNAIKASETNMKTNAVGTWEGTDWLWGTSQKSVGPIYLDINIYPEYQKSMMVETGLIAGGDGGIDIPLLNALAEKFNYDEYAGRVNKSLAEKVTTNVLRQSVKDMYEGEICILGDASLKPYDRVSIVDLYEDMSGNVEVETVIHAMNAETGFTTTFIPDVIVRSENAAQEYGLQSSLSPAIISLASVGTTRFLLNKFASKGFNGLLKLGIKASVEKTGQALVTRTAANTFLNTMAKGIVAGSNATAGGMTSLAAILSNPLTLTGAVFAAGSIYMLGMNYKEMFTRFCRNIQALTVFPITKNGRLLIAGMSGHRGSVYGYTYDSKTAMNSVQGYVMKFLGGDTDNGFINALGTVTNFLFCDENYDAVQNQWITNLGLEQTNDIMKSGDYSPANIEKFAQSLISSVAMEYSARSAALAAMRTKPRITSFNTSNRTSEVYLKYQIGGLHDKSKEQINKLGVDEKLAAALTVADLSTHERIKELIPIEDDPEIKLALTSGEHPVIKQFQIQQAYSPETFDLKMECENTIIRYMVDGDGNTIFDLPMLRDDALTILKLIINEDNMQGKIVTFLSGTMVNSTASWKSTGFAFSLACDDIKALEGATKTIKKDKGWALGNELFAYKNTGKSIQYTVYAPIEDAAAKKEDLSNSGDK